jgi:hypothetical protein
MSPGAPRSGHEELWRLLVERIPAIGGVEETETLMEIKVHKADYSYTSPLEAPSRFRDKRGIVLRIETRREEAPPAPGGSCY